MTRLKVAICNPLAALCGTLADWCTIAQRHLLLCRDCGRSRYYGKPCNG